MTKRAVAQASASVAVAASTETLNVLWMGRGCVGVLGLTMWVWCVPEVSIRVWK